MVFGGKLGWFRGGGGRVAVLVFGVRRRGPGHDEVAQRGRGSEDSVVGELVFARTETRKSSESWNAHLARLEDIHTAGRQRKLTYNVVARLLNAADYGVPQTRERAFIVGFRSDLHSDWHFPQATHSKARLLHDQWVSGEYWSQHGLRTPKSVPARFKRQAERLSATSPPDIKPWQTVRDAIHDLPSPSETSQDHRIQHGAKVYAGHTGSPLDWPSKTLKAGVHGVPGGENMMVHPNGSVRYFTIREAARIQTFPDAWKFKGAWSLAMKQLGNAVPMQLASVVAESVAKKLREQPAAITA